MIFDDFWRLMNEFNTVTSAIQSYGDFCHDFEGIARNAENEADFRKALDDHRRTQLRYWRTSLENISQEVGISYSRIPTGLWNDLLDLISQSPLVRPEDERGWQSPVSLQGLIEVLQHFYQRLVPPAPLAIKPPTPAPSPAADHIPPPSHSINRKPAQPTRTLRPRKQTEKKNAVRHGRVQKRDPGGSSKGKECSPRKIYTRSCKKAATRDSTVYTKDSWTGWRKG